MRPLSQRVLKIPFLYDTNHISKITAISTGSIIHLISPQCRIYASVNWVSIGSDNGLSPIQPQAIIYTYVGSLSIGPLGTNFNEIVIKIQNFSFMKMHLKISSAIRRPFCPGRDDLIDVIYLPGCSMKKVFLSFVWKIVEGKCACSSSLKNDEMATNFPLASLSQGISNSAGHFSGLIISGGLSGKHKLG